METTIKQVNLKAVEKAAELIEQASWILEKAERFIDKNFDTKDAENQARRYCIIRSDLNESLERLGVTLGHEDTEHWLPF